LFAIERAQNRVLAMVECHRKERALAVLHIHRERTIEKGRGTLEFAGLELRPGCLGVDRGDGEEEIEAGGDIVYGAVGAGDGIDVYASAQRAMGGRLEAGGGAGKGGDALKARVKYSG